MATIVSENVGAMGPWLVVLNGELKQHDGMAIENLLKAVEWELAAYDPSALHRVHRQRVDDLGELVTGGVPVAEQFGRDSVAVCLVTD